jgi:nucleoside-diphosphate-sugar epimerase
MAKILIAGCGDIGLGVAEELIEAGHHVTGLRRSPPASTSDSLVFLPADLTDRQTLCGLEDQFDLVVFMPSPDTRTEEAYTALYRHGLQTLMKTIPSARWLQVSSTSVYGQQRGEWVDENSETSSENFRSRLLLEAENIVHRQGDNNVVVRFAGIYGPSRYWLIRQLLSGKPIQYDPPNYTNRIHRHDAVGVLSMLVKKMLAGESLPSTILASDGVPVPLHEVLGWIASEMKLPAPEKITVLAGAQNKRCDIRLLRRLGYAFRYRDYREGYAEVIRSYLKQHVG